MISAIVLTPDAWTGADLALEREKVVRSLVWLVSAVVSGVVRDVTLAVPIGLGLSDVADQSGCALVQTETEADRLSAAVAQARQPRLLILEAGFQPDAGIVEEVETFLRREGEDGIAILLASPRTMLERLLPNTAPPVGVIVPRTRVPPGANTKELARMARRGGQVLSCRARPIL